MSNCLKTFADVPDREKILNTSAARRLLKALPDKTRNSFVTAFLGLSLDWDKRDVISFLTTNSEIGRTGHLQQGSATPFEVAYTQTAHTEIDKYWIESNAGRQIYQRLKVIQRELPKYIDLAGPHNGNKVLIDNIGSGVGRDIIGTLEANPLLQSMVHTRFIDCDEKSLRIAKQIVQEKRMTESFSFHADKFRNIPPRGADLLLLIGILCPLNKNLCKKILKNMKSYVRSEGIIIYSTVTKDMLIDDPLTDFMMRIHGWEMDYKTPEECGEIATVSGWNVLDTFFDEPGKHHCITVAQTS
ncbi:MAG: methyltransferase domain-containing protein [Pseudomonadota bacterium]